jgi:hypothetical protein
MRYLSKQGYLRGGGVDCSNASSRDVVQIVQVE